MYVHLFLVHKGIRNIRLAFFFSPEFYSAKRWFRWRTCLDRLYHCTGWMAKHICTMTETRHDCASLFSHGCADHPRIHCAEKSAEKSIYRKIRGKKNPQRSVEYKWPPYNGWGARVWQPCSWLHLPIAWAIKISEGYVGARRLSIFNLLGVTIEFGWQNSWCT